jgi:hypothetical protein
MTVPLIADEEAEVGVEALSVSLTTKLKLGFVTVKVPLMLPVPLFCMSDGVRGGGGTVVQVNGGTPPVVEQVTVYCEPTSVVPDAEQLTAGAATML